MSLLDDVSIVVTPNGVKASKLYAVIPSNGDADMDVTRATAATRVDEDGLVNYAEVLGGEEVTNGDFETSGTPSTNTWTLGWYSNTANVSISGGKITLTNSPSESDSRAYATNGVSSNNILITNQLYKLQYEVIANNGVTSFKYYSSSGVFIDAPIDLGVTHTIYIKNTSNQLFLFQNTTTNSNISLDNVSVKEVTRDNVPRIDYTGGGCPHILAEPQRTNLFAYSEDFTSGWSTSDATITANSTISPDGTQNASTLTTTASGGTVQESLSISDGDIAFSLFVKKGSTDGVRLRIDASTDFNAYFDLTDGTIHSTTGNAKIETLDNDWYKISVSASVTSFVKTSIYTTDGTTSYDNGTVFIWGAQLEEGSYATSYIPNFGTAAGVTRVQDIFTRDGIGSLINSTEGVLFIEASTFENGADCRITLSDGTITNRVSVEWDILANTIKGFVGSDGNLVSPATYNQTNSNKIALKYKENDCALWINGTKVDTDFSVSALSGTNQLEFSNYGGLLPFEGKVKQLQVYTTALGGSPYDATLSDARLAALTSL